MHRCGRLRGRAPPGPPAAPPSHSGGFHSTKRRGPWGLPSCCTSATCSTPAPGQGSWAQAQAFWSSNVVCTQTGAGAAWAASAWAAWQLQQLQQRRRRTQQQARVRKGVRHGGAGHDEAGRAAVLLEAQPPQPPQHQRHVAAKDALRGVPGGGGGRAGSVALPPQRAQAATCQQGSGCHLPAGVSHLPAGVRLPPASRGQAATCQQGSGRLSGLRLPPASRAPTPRRWNPAQPSAAPTPRPPSPPSPAPLPLPLPGWQAGAPCTRAPRPPPRT
jgi:hypothetical protein